MEYKQKVSGIECGWVGNGADLRGACYMCGLFLSCLMELGDSLKCGPLAW